MMNPIEYFLEMLEIPSASGKEHRFSIFLMESMKNLGYEVKQDEAGNVIGKIGKGEPMLLFSSHIDTVPGEIPIREENGRIYGRGAVDAKASIASMILAGSFLPEMNVNGTVIFAGLVEEESSLRGIQTLLEGDLGADWAIFGEPTKCDRICLASKGRLLFKINLKTEGGHVACSWAYKNSIELAYKLWKKFKENVEAHEKTPFFSTVTNLTQISGGSAPNVVPGDCQLFIDVRFPHLVKSTKLLGIIEKTFNEFKEMNEVQISYEVLSQIEGFRAPKDSILVKELAKAIREVRNIDPRYIRKTGTCFMNLIGPWRNIPTISYGPGDPALEHTNDEHIEKQEYLDSLEILKKTIKNILSKKNTEHEVPNTL
ncbi:MAG: M20/M25/M40 family metallo-hydrolase [Candidatus Freyarchaeum deiterrae]